MNHELADTLRILARELRQDTGAQLPGTLDEVVHIVE
jgi:hypothetical protein